MFVYDDLCVCRCLFTMVCVSVAVCLQWSVCLWLFVYNGLCVCGCLFTMVCVSVAVCLQWSVCLWLFVYNGLCVYSCLFMVVHCPCSWCPEDRSSDQMVTVLVPLIFDATTEYIADVVSIRTSSQPVIKSSYSTVKNILYKMQNTCTHKKNKIISVLFTTDM